MKTLALDPVSWDLTIDASGNIATVSDDPPVPLGLAQDAASAIRLFKGELYFDTTQGIPYFSQILGRRPPFSLVKAYFVNAALTVPGVARAVCYISSFTNRGVFGQVQVFNASGNAAIAPISSVLPPPSSSGPSLDFSDPGNSQYLPGLT